MKTYEITNENVSYYVDSISVPVNATEEDINDGLSNAEMDISIDWGDAWGIKQDKIPLIIKVCVFERED